MGTRDGDTGWGHPPRQGTQTRSPPAPTRSPHTRGVPVLPGVVCEHTRVAAPVCPIPRVTGVTGTLSRCQGDAQHPKKGPGGSGRGRGGGLIWGCCPPAPLPGPATPCQGDTGQPDPPVPLPRTRQQRPERRLPGQRRDHGARRGPAPAAAAAAPRQRRDPRAHRVPLLGLAAGRLRGSGPEQPEPWMRRAGLEPVPLAAPAGAEEQRHRGPEPLGPPVVRHGGAGPGGEPAAGAARGLLQQRHGPADPAPGGEPPARRAPRRLPARAELPVRVLPLRRAGHRPGALLPPGAAVSVLHSPPASLRRHGVPRPGVRAPPAAGGRGGRGGRCRGRAGGRGRCRRLVPAEESGSRGDGRGEAGSRWEPPAAPLRQPGPRGGHRRWHRGPRLREHLREPRHGPGCRAGVGTGVAGAALQVLADEDYFLESAADPGDQPIYANTLGLAEDVYIIPDQ